MPKGWRESSVVERLPGMYKVLAVEDPTAGSWGVGSSVVRVIDGCISLRTLVGSPASL